MRFYLTSLLIVLFIISCKENDEKHFQNDKNIIYTNFIFETILEDSISVRALTIDSNLVWFSGTNGKFGHINLKTKKVFNGKIVKDSLLPEFRSIAQNKDHVYLLSIASPALLYQISKNDKQIKLVYQNHNQNVFFDSMHFLNNKIGFAMGDPVDNFFQILITENFGKTWREISTQNFPKLLSGEAAFAASNSCMVVKNEHLWIFSGGTKSRVFHSKNLGKSWEVFHTPIIQGQKMTGIFAADFYDTKIGLIAGGNYDQPKSNKANKALTTDGGKTWKLIANNEAFGYTSDIKFLPNSGAKSILSVGATGVWYSYDKGENWNKISTDKQFYAIKFANDSTAVLSGKNTIVTLQFHQKKEGLN